MNALIPTTNDQMCRSRNAADSKKVTQHKFEGQRLLNDLQTVVWQSQHTLWRCQYRTSHIKHLDIRSHRSGSTNVFKSKTIHFTYSRLKQGVAWFEINVSEGSIQY